MTLTEDDLREFAALWSDEFHEAITEKEAAMAASLLLELCFLLVSGAGDKSMTQPQE